MNELRGKRLLLLGGSLWKDAIKSFADEYEIELIAAGKNTSAGIFEIAKEKYNINSIDVSQMKKFIVDKQIDGVYMGGSEIVISAATKYLADLNYPCYCTNSQWNMLQNKNNFKKLCIENQLPVVPSYSLEEVLSKNEEIYPVITKPSDGSGSNGFSICRNKDELINGYDRAKKDSPTESVIIEKFVNNKANVVFYTLHEGKVYFSGFSDKYPVKYKKFGSYVGGLFVYESKYTDEFRSLYEEKIQKLVTSLSLKEGTFWIEVFHSGSNYYFNEVGFRYGGSVSPYPTDYFYGINQIYSDIYYALTGKSKINGFTSLISSEKMKKKYYAIYPIHLLPGKIGEIEGADELLKINQIIEVFTSKKIGDQIYDTGSFNQVFSLIHVTFDTQEELKEILNQIHQMLEVNEIDGNQKKNLVNKMLDIDHLVI